MNLTNKCRASN